MKEGRVRSSYVGKKRILTHILLLILLGGLFLGLGLRGRALLLKETENAQRLKTVDTLHTAGMEAVKRALVEAGADEARADRWIVSKKRSLKKATEQMLAENQTPEQVYAAIQSAVLEAASKADPENADSIRERVKAGTEQQAQAVRAAFENASESLSVGEVRRRLAVNRPFYAAMFYSLPLIIVGGLMLLLAFCLVCVWFAFDTERKVRFAEKLEPMDYLLPFFLGVAVFTLYPVVRVVLMSFQERYRLDGSFAGWGIGNYRYVLHGIEGTSNYFMQGVRNTLLFVLYTVPFATLLALVIACLLNQKLRFSALFQTGYFLPMVTSVTAVGLVWRWIFNQNFGLLNAILSLFGVPKINWLLEASRSMPVLVIFAVWSSLPFTIILLLSGLQNIDDTYYTVARVDGAKAFRIFRRITVPLLAPTIGLVLTINSISAFKVFTDVTVLFNGSPGPAKNMYTMVFYIFEIMRGDNLEYGRAAAASIILFLIIFAVTMVQRLIQRKWNYT